MSNRGTFGTAIRAARIGFGYVASMDHWVRITQRTPDGDVTVEVADPPLPSTASKGEFTCWWGDGRAWRGEAPEPWLLAIIKDLSVGIHVISADTPIEEES